MKLRTCKSCSFDGRTIKVMIISPSPEVEAGGDYVESVVGDSNVVILDTCDCSLYRCHFVQSNCSKRWQILSEKKTALGLPALLVSFFIIRGCEWFQFHFKQESKAATIPFISKKCKYIQVWSNCVESCL